MRVALVGMDSFFFTTRLGELLGELPHVEWAACCDLGVSAEEVRANTGATAEELAARHGVPLYRNLSDVLDRARPGAAIVATHPRRVPNAVAQLAAANLHCYVVKPAALTRAGIDQLRRSLLSSDRVLISGPTYRLHPTVQSAVSAAQRGAVGAVSSLRIMHQHGRLSGWPAESWYRTEPALTPALYLGWYVVDLLHWITGEGVGHVRVAGSHLADPDSPHVDTIRALCRTRSGRVAALDVYFGVAWPYPDLELEVLGTEGAIRVNTREGGQGYGRAEDTDFALESVDPTTIEIQEWVNACRGEREAWTNPREWLDVLEDCHTLQDALRREGAPR